MRLLELQLDLYETKTNGLSTEDGSVKALLQILYSQYLSLGVRSPWVLASIDIIVSVKSLYT